jgi:tetratricopeptide (TPR) repeat protein
LFDSELSVARMLDGRRTLRALIAAAQAVGVRVTLETLREFVSQLKTWRFVDAAVSDASTTWTRRRPWSADVRRRFRQALQSFRSGNVEEALEPLERIIEVDPGNEEALFLRARLRAERDGATELDVPFEVMHTREDPFATLDAVTDPARKALVGDGPRLWSGDGDGDSQPTHAEMQALEAPPPPRRVVPIAIACGVGVAALAFALLHPVDKRVESGTPVKAGQVVAHVTPSNAAEVARLTGEVRDDEAARQKLVRAVAPAAKVAAARKQVALAQTQLSAATVAKKKLGLAKTAAAKKRLAAAEAAVTAKSAALERAKTALEALGHADAIDRLTRSVDTGKRAVEAATKSARPIEVKVAHDGVWLQDGARVVASSLEVKLAVKPVPTAGPVSLTLPSGAKQAVSDGVRVTLPFERELLNVSGTLWVVDGTTAWLFSH